MKSMNETDGTKSAKPKHCHFIFATPPIKYDPSNENPWIETRGDQILNLMLGKIEESGFIAVAEVKRKVYRDEVIEALKKKYPKWTFTSFKPSEWVDTPIHHRDATKHARSQIKKGRAKRKPIVLFAAKQCVITRNKPRKARHLRPPLAPAKPPYFLLFRPTDSEEMAKVFRIWSRHDDHKSSDWIREWRAVDCRRDRKLIREVADFCKRTRHNWLFRIVPSNHLPQDTHPQTYWHDVFTNAVDDLDAWLSGGVAAPSDRSNDVELRRAIVARFTSTRSLASNGRTPAGASGPPHPPTGKPIYSPAMTKAEMARRCDFVTTKQMETAFAAYGLENVGGYKWRVRIDQMEPRYRAKLEAD